MAQELLRGSHPPHSVRHQIIPSYELKPLVQKAFALVTLVMVPIEPAVRVPVPAILYAKVHPKQMPTAAGVLSEQRAGPSGVSWWHDACAKTQGHHGPPQGGCRQVRARPTGQGLWCNSTTDSGTQSHLPGGHCRGGGMRSSLQALGGTPTRPHYVSS